MVQTKAKGDSYKVLQKKSILCIAQYIVIEFYIESILCIAYYKIIEFQREYLFYS